jgi:hypothetical protein
MNDLLESTVQFQVCDLVHPRSAEVLWELYARNRLEGQVVAVTDDGLSAARYLVVRVSGVSEPVIVPESEVLTHRPPLDQVEPSAVVCDFGKICEKVG